MQRFVFQETGIDGLVQITPFCAADQRGFFTKPFERSVFAEHGIELTLWEELRSLSHKGVLRGLHFQHRNSQDKLVQVLHGAAYDVAVDLRKNSPTCGQWKGFYLTAENQQMITSPKALPTASWRWRRGRCSTTSAATDTRLMRMAGYAGTTRSWRLTGRWSR